MKKMSRRLASVIVLGSLSFLVGCSPATWLAAGSIGAVGGYLTSLLFPVTTTERTCYVNGEEVDCSTVTGKCIGE
jgi:hypothetical protein